MTVETFGRIDILVCCAGGAETRLLGKSGVFHDLPIEVIDFGIDLNLKGALYLYPAIMAQMVKPQGGIIINLGSIITGKEECQFDLAYSASKSALMNGVVKSLAQAGAPYHIRVISASVV